MKESDRLKKLSTLALRQRRQGLARLLPPVEETLRGCLIEHCMRGQLGVSFWVAERSKWKSRLGRSRDKRVAPTCRVFYRLQPTASIGRLEPRPESTFPLVASEPQRNTLKGDIGHAENHSSLTHALPGKHTAA